MIRTCFIGEKFLLNGIDDTLIDERDPSIRPFRNTTDLRTKYVCKNFKINKSDVKMNLDWYLNYIQLNQFIYREGPNHKASRFNTGEAYYMLSYGYIPVGFSPSFSQDMTIMLNKLLEQQHIPVVRRFPSSFINPYCKMKGTDIWVHKLEAAKVLGCEPRDVRSVDFIRKVVGA